MFLSRRYRPNKWPFYGLLAVELPLTVGLLALFGIAAPNLYRTKLRQDGADNGFNSSPAAALYAAANYESYTQPKVWSQFITNYNVVIVVLSMFLMLVKSVLYILHVFPPILSSFVHLVLVALYAVSVYYQSSSDTSDPEALQKGAPWYITKPCSVTRNKSLVGYCTQAKASFACTCVALALFIAYAGLSIWSCFPSKQQRLDYAERRRARAEKYSKWEAMSAEVAALQDDDNHEPKESHGTAYQVPYASGGLNPVTPRTLAFNTLGGTTAGPVAGTTETTPATTKAGVTTTTSPTRDLPLRNHFSTPNAPTSPTFATRSPDVPRSPGFGQFEQSTSTAGASTAMQKQKSPVSITTPKMYFPPPPKKAVK